MWTIKTKFTEDLLNKNIPCFLSLANPRGSDGWHIMLVFRMERDNLILKNNNEIINIPKNTVSNIHDNLQGGKDIAWIEIEDVNKRDVPKND